MRGRRRGRFGRKARKGQRRAAGMTAANKTENCKANPLIFFNERILEWCFKKLVRIATSSGMAASDAITLCLGTSRTDCNCPSSLGMQKQAFFASAHPARIATGILPPLLRRHRLCLGTSRTDCNTRRTCWRGACWRALSRHIPHGLQRETEWRTSCSRIFASAHPARIATPPDALILIRPELCLGTSRTDCNRAFVSSAISAPSFASAHPARIATPWASWVSYRPSALPRHIPHGLQRGLRFPALLFASFASAHPARIATGQRSIKKRKEKTFASAHPARIATTKVHRV